MTSSNTHLGNILIKYQRLRRKHHNHFRILIIWMGLIITPFLVLLLWDEVESLIQNFQYKKKVAKHLAATQEHLYVEDVNRPMCNMHPPIKEQKDGEFWHRVYPYSVVDGGVHSVQELRSAIRRDPVVAKHYSNFKLDRARVIEANAGRDFHVSYRIGEEIFWTKKRLKVAKGERLITDGTNFTRTRCANMLSEVPPGKTFPYEPPPEVFDTPLDPPSDPSPSPPVIIGGAPPTTTLPPSDPTPFVPPIVIGGAPPTTTLPPSDPTPFVPPIVIGGGPPTTTLSPSDPTPFMPPVVIGGEPPTTTLPPSDPSPFIPPIVIGGGPIDPPDGSSNRDGDGYGEGNSIAPVPEPSTMLLLGSGLLGLLGLRRKFKK
jgi:hypothetical protein